jgi:hypothetical protein
MTWARLATTIRTETFIPGRRRLDRAMSTRTGERDDTAGIGAGKGREGDLAAERLAAERVDPNDGAEARA